MYSENYVKTIIIYNDLVKVKIKLFSLPTNMNSSKNK